MVDAKQASEIQADTSVSDNAAKQSFAEKFLHETIRKEYATVKAQLVAAKKAHDYDNCFAEVKKMHPDWPEDQIKTACEKETSTDKGEGKEAVGYTVAGVNKNSLHKLSHTFKWAMPIDMKGQLPKSYMLIKGAAMSEGVAKRGENMTKDNIIFAAGAMSAFGMLGLSQIDIDHFEHALPAAYENEYPGISNPYPPGLVIDAAVDKNTIDGKEVHQVEFIAFLTNPKVYEMVEQGKFIGTSVVDAFRKEHCDCGHTGKDCTCTMEGSHFVHNTLVLKGVPNSNGTWVAPVTEEDLGTLIVNMTPDELGKIAGNIKMQNKLALIQRAHEVKKLWDEEMGACMTEAKSAGKEGDEATAYCMKKLGRNSVPATATEAVVKPEVIKTTTETHEQVKAQTEVVATATADNTKKHSLEEFYDINAGQVVLGTPENVSAIESFLGEKGLTPEMSHELTGYLKSNPKALSRQQIEHASAADLSAWFSHLRLNSLFATIESQQRTISLITKIRPHKDSATFSEALDMVSRYNDRVTGKALHTMESAKYAVQAEVKDGKSCIGCKWFVQNAISPNAETGFCSMVEGQIAHAGICNNFAKIEDAIAVAKTIAPAEVSAPVIDSLKHKAAEAKNNSPDNAEKIAEIAASGAAVATEHSTPENTKPSPMIKIDMNTSMHSINESLKDKHIMTLEEKKAELARVEKMTAVGGRRTSMNNYDDLRKQFKEYLKRDVESAEAQQDLLVKAEHTMAEKNAAQSTTQPAKTAEEVKK